MSADADHAASAPAPGDPEPAVSEPASGAPGAAGQPETADKPENTREPETAPEPEAAREPETAGQPETAGESETADNEPETAGQPENARESETAGQPENARESETTDQPETTGQPETSRAPGRRAGRRAMLSAVTGVLALALGLGLTVQIRASNADEPYSGTSEEDLVAVLNDVAGNEERLREQIVDSRAALEELTDDRSESDSALDQAEQRAEAIGILTGQLAAEGPGIRLSVSDPEEQIDASLLLEAVQELRGAGAEAIEVNDIRVVVSSAFVDTTAGIQVEGAILTEPYTVLAIGPPEDMDAALSVPGGVLRDAERAGATAGVTTLDTVTVDALVGDPAAD